MYAMKASGLRLLCLFVAWLVGSTGRTINSKCMPKLCSLTQKLSTYPTLSYAACPAGRPQAFRAILMACCRILGMFGNQFLLEMASRQET